MQIVRRVLLAWLVALAAGSPLARAQSYPTKPIRMIVAFAAGGSADINARIIAQQLAAELGGSVVIENRGGAGGNLGAVEVARAQPDGYTVFYATSAVALAPAVYVKPGFRPDADFAPVSLTATIPLVLVVNSAVPAKTASEFVDWVKAQGGKVNYGSSGRGALLHLAGELFLKETGLSATHVPYRGSAPAITDLLSGSTQFMFLPINEARTHVEGGGMRALAVTHEQRLPQLPHVPTMKEAFGLTTMNMGAWQGLLVPAGTPAAITTILGGALEKTLRNEALRARLTEGGSIVLGGTAKEYADYMRSEGERWAKIVQAAGIAAE
ncbi:tripartite tricarboxylate transporter substrate binding protein [Bradyrhizobium sp. LVM 105]|uniref:Bug family tripartite tricarboxylate transporter substrate binding protein n=1 Tax=Bradyrhizobium sp. LVM 105 TaxID=2341115 RepID=UPI000F80C1EE|nr:tripartite tricarboxylate transporter substrate binding protein [Bradyrhizobium sp. LVM 105]RTE93647.1 tripartite tricarboxylate transporter substrate binding protein [Bradyrhizobium sp. LVM 105]